MSPPLQVSPSPFLSVNIIDTPFHVHTFQWYGPRPPGKNACPASGTRRRQAVATVWQMDTCLDSAAYALESLRQS